MATDDERREAAERLRDVARAARWSLGDIGFTEAMHRALGGGDWRDMTERLADLIDPDCDEGRYSVARTARPIDRDALLALADKVVADTEEDVRSEDLVPACWAGEALRDVASRIREACGEVVE